MSQGLCFWILVLIAIACDAWPIVRSRGESLRTSAPNVVWWALLILLGWAVFGPPMHG